MIGVIDLGMNIIVFKIEFGGDNLFYFKIKCFGVINVE